MSSFKRDAKETAQVGVLVWITGGMVFLMLLGFAIVNTGAYYTFLPWMRQQETVINRSSQGYIDTKQAYLLRLTQDGYRFSDEITQRRGRGEDVRNAESQLRVTLDTIEKEAATIAPEYVPSQTREFMSRHGRAI